MAELPVAGLFDLDKMKTPDSSDVLLAFHIDASGKPIEAESGYYTVALLIQTLGQIATNAEQGAISAKTAAEAAQAACEAALAAIGNSDTTGLRGQAITAINNARIAALAAIGESDSAGARGNAIAAINAKLQESLEAWASQISLDNGNWDAKVVADNSALDQKISSANQTIDAKVTEATEQAGVATTKAGEASQSAQDASGSADTATQKASEASQSAQDAADSASAASTSEQNASASEEAASDSASAAATSESNAGASATTATEQAGIATTKAGEASTSASQAAESKTGADNAKSLAEKYANAPEDEVVETVDGVPQYSAKHYMYKAEDAANSPLASQTVAGRVYISGSVDDVTGENKTQTAVDKAAVQALRTALQDAINSEKTARESADSAINEAISTETTNRSNGDTALQQNIDAEAQSRLSGDSALQQSIAGEAQARTAADAQLQTQINERRLPCGFVVWYVGLLANAPVDTKGYLVCNGQAVSRTTYAALFAIIGTKYGAGDGSTTFNVPNLTDGNGRFIRAGFSDDVIGTKQDDAIRNISGATTMVWGSDEDYGISGAFYRASNTTRGMTGGNAGTRDYRTSFSASRSVPTATEVRPYSFIALPLISY